MLIRGQQVKRNVSLNNSRLRLLIESTFSDKAVTSHKYGDFINHELPFCDPVQFANFMRLTGKKSNRQYNLLKIHLPAIASRLNKLSSLLWSFRDISSLVYGLQCMTEKDNGLPSYLSVVTKVVTESIQEIGRAHV